MMQGRGKSGEVVVARKPVNKAERSVAEPVERRAEAEGNASQQSTFRAQSREDASQALERIRQRAKEKKEEKFISLLHHIDPELLEEAFYELKVDAAAGVDGLTWKDYEQDLERKLADLQARVHRGAYRALPSRRGTTHHRHVRPHPRAGEGRAGEQRPRAPPRRANAA